MKDKLGKINHKAGLNEILGRLTIVSCTIPSLNQDTYLVTPSLKLILDFTLVA